MTRVEWDRLSPEGEPTTYNILFVCTGNTCRSPMAEVIMRGQLRERGWTNIEVGSAGIAAADGEPAAGNAMIVAEEEGLDLGEHGARFLTPELVEWADLILAMSPSHLHGIDHLSGGSKAALVTDFEDEGEGRGLPVDDPYGSDLEAYRRTYHRLERAIEAVLSKIEPIVAP